MAVKIHQLNSSWGESKKASYVKHAIREYNIHRSLRHPRIVGLLDIFEIDAHTFATVLELCRGGELESHLKEHQVCACAHVHDAPCVHVVVIRRHRQPFDGRTGVCMHTPPTA